MIAKMDDTVIDEEVKKRFSQVDGEWGMRGEGCQEERRREEGKRKEGKMMRAARR